MELPSVAPDVFEDYLTFLRFASISTDPQYQPQVIACANWLVEKMNSWGLVTALHQTAGHPVVVGHGPKKPGRPTVLIYGHYDVQPVDPLELWESPPFEPIVKDGYVVARGSSDNKGQIFAHLQGLRRTLAATGDLPVNIVVLIEGEEEMGSPNLAPFLRSHAQELACDVVAISDTAMVAPDFPTFAYGLRGLAALEVHLTGPVRDLHSGGFGGVVENPVTVLARLLAGLHDKNRKITVPGFYDDVVPCEPWEREEWARLSDKEESLQEEAGVSEFAGEAGFSTWERLWVRPTAEVNGIGGGYQGEGTKTVLPSKAFAKLTFRLVAKQDPHKVLEQVKQYFIDNCPSTVKMELVSGHCAAAYVVNPQVGFGKAAQKALGRLFPGKKPALVRVGGSIPIVVEFASILKAETLLLGLCLENCRAHSPNETFPVRHLELGARLNAYLLEELSQV
jgi:acetylornithine deacetylase/succinyl-diaminopimelate desuccinylase-like protein